MLSPPGATPFLVDDVIEKPEVYEALMTSYCSASSSSIICASFESNYIHDEM
jgi:hypothetical protein